MRLVVVTVVVTFLLSMPRANAAAQSSPTLITYCQNIIQPGNYVLTNDLVLNTVGGYGTGGDCLVISSSHVNVDMRSWNITVACPPFPYCPRRKGRLETPPFT
jgi:hypothetical protein